MHIFYASDTTPNPSFQSNLWRNNLYLPLVDLGHNVTEFDYDLRATFQNVDPQHADQRAFIMQNRPKVSQELLRQIAQIHQRKPIDLFFSYFYDACVTPETIDQIRALGIKTVNWYCNGSYQLNLVSEISPRYDWCLVPEKFRLADYAALGAHPIYCQEAANPTIYKPYPVPVEHDVVFVGQAYGERPEYIKFLLDQGINIRVWGQGWHRHSSTRLGKSTRNLFQQARYIAQRLATEDGRKGARWRLEQQFRRRSTPTVTAAQASDLITLPEQTLGGPLSDQEMVAMYSKAKINIGFSSVGNTHQTDERIVQVRLRDFEIPMSGGFYIVEYMEELEEFFHIGEEIVCYSDKEDLSQKIQYYLAHDEEREQIRQAGYQRCLRDHTWHRRFEGAFQEMGLA